MSDILPAPRHKYDNPRKQEAYEFYIGGATQVEVTKLTGLSKRSIAKWSSEDGWTAERDDRQRAMLHAVAVASVSAPPDALAALSGASLQHRLAEALKSEDVRLRIGAVMMKQRALFDALLDDVQRAYDAKRAKAAGAGKDLALNELFPIVKIAVDVAAAHRKAHGVPEKMELTGKDGGPLAYRDVSEMTDAELDAELARMEAEAAGSTAGAVN